MGFDFSLTPQGDANWAAFMAGCFPESDDLSIRPRFDAHGGRIPAGLSTYRADEDEDDDGEDEDTFAEVEAKLATANVENQQLRAQLAALTAKLATPQGEKKTVAENLIYSIPKAEGLSPDEDRELRSVKEYVGEYLLTNIYADAGLSVSDYVDSRLIDLHGRNKLGLTPLQQRPALASALAKQSAQICEQARPIAS